MSRRPRPHRHRSKTPSTLGDVVRARAERLARGFVSAGFAPGDTEYERLARATLTLVVGFILVLSPLWIATYLVLGRPLSAAIPGVYEVIAIARLGHLFVRPMTTYGLIGLDLARASQ